MKTLSIFAFSILTFAVSADQMMAATITLGGPLPTQRTASLSDAQSGVGNSATGAGNATAAIVSVELGSPYSEVGSIAGGNGGPGIYTDGIFKVEVLTGFWGDNGPLTGTWTITNSSFWTTYGNGAISLHVGNGGGDPDHFTWKLTTGVTSGNWSYDGSTLRGGGLSNLKLYGGGTPTTRQVPDGGATIALLGLSLLGFGSARRLMNLKA